MKLGRIRSVLFVPANQQKMIDKARSLPADAIAFDLEDGVPPAEKETARNQLKQISAWDGPSLPLVRINALGVGVLEADVAAALSASPHAIILPKVESADQVRTLCAMLSAAVGVIPSIETARGILRAEAIAEADDRVVALTFGPEDFARELAVERSRDGAERMQAIGLLVLAANAAGLPMLDGPFGDFRDPEGLESECRRDQAIGVKGKCAIHPSQLDVINHIFSPSAELVEWARRAVGLFEQGRSEGRGAVSLDGQMVDEPVYRRAKDILAENS